MLKKISVRSKLFILLSFPLAAIIFLVCSISVDKYKEPTGTRDQVPFLSGCVTTSPAATLTTNLVNLMERRHLRDSLRLSIPVIVSDISFGRKMTDGM